MTIYSNKQRKFLNSAFHLSFDSNDLDLEFYSLRELYSYDSTIRPLITEFNDFLDSEVQNPNTIEHFLFLRQSTITSFFASYRVDMPVCFKKSKSLYSRTFEIPFLKLSNMVMRAGYRGQVAKNVSFSFANCFHKFIQSQESPKFVKWQSLYTFLYNTSISSSGVMSSPFHGGSLLLDSLHSYSPEEGFFNKKSFIKNFLFEKLFKHAPLFSFYIRRVDKSVRKNSRGKSGKYTIIWKYVPVYKRLYVTTRWLLKDLKFQRLKTFTDRLIRILETFLMTPHLSFVWKLRKFTHHFVFRNFRTSLLQTLKSTS